MSVGWEKRQAEVQTPPSLRWRRDGKGYGFKLIWGWPHICPANYNNVMLNSLHHSLAAETSSQAFRYVHFLKRHGFYMWVFLCSCFLLFPLPSPVGCVWGWQPGGAAVQRPSLGTLQQGVEQQQLQWIRDQLRVWLRERKQLQREWRQQALALLQPRGKGFCSLLFRAAICYYAHSDLFPAKPTKGGCGEMHKKNGRE